jgi:hypothetical protein
MATTFDRVTPQTRWGFQVASILAEYAGHNEIGLDELLAGAVFSGDNAAIQVLRRLGFAPLRVHQVLVRPVRIEGGRQCRVRARLSSTSRPCMTAASPAHTTGARRSSRRRACRSLRACPCWTSQRTTNGRNRSSASGRGRPHWCSPSSGPTTMTARPE